MLLRMSLLLALSAAPSSAQMFNGERLLAICQPDGEDWRFCLGFIQGVDDGARRGAMIGLAAKDQTITDPHREMTAALGYCAAIRMPVEEKAEAVIRYLRAHPEDGKKPADLPVMDAFRAAFPCPEG